MAFAGSAAAQDAAQPTSTYFEGAKITVNERARADGFMRVRVVPENGAPREATLAIAKRMNENELARGIADALNTVLGARVRRRQGRRRARQDSQEDSATPPTSRSRSRSTRRASPSSSTTEARACAPAGVSRAAASGSAAGRVALQSRTRCNASSIKCASPCGSGMTQGGWRRKPLPIAVLNDGVQERQVLADEADVRALAALEERLEVAIDAVEIVLEPQARRRLIERQRLAEQVLRRVVQHFALRALVDGDAAEHELGVQPVAALL